jgi:hypothetical protein
MEMVLETTVNQIGRRRKTGLEIIPLLSIGAALTAPKRVRSEGNKLHGDRKNDGIVPGA